MYALNPPTSRFKRGGIGVLIFALVLTGLSAISITPASAASGVETSGLCSSTVGETDRASIAQLDNDCVLTFVAANQSTSSNSNSWTVPTGVREANILVVAGGGAGGARHGGGGGAGGLVYLENVGVNAGGTAIAINVGGGGASGCCGGGSGSNSTVTLSSAAVSSTIITAVGGGGGGGAYAGNGYAGGSSGGGAATNTPMDSTQGNQNYGFGNIGAAGTGGSESDYSGGGGGGAGGAGVAGTKAPLVPGRGGLGKVISITGSNVCYAAGGGGGGYGVSASTLTNGGYCTAGQLVGGSGSLGASGVAGTPVSNTGSGGGGGGFNGGTNATAGSGAAGVVIIRWTIPGYTGAFPDVSGLSARFNASNFNTTLNGGLGTWADTSGSGYHIASTNITGTAITMGTSGSNANGSNKTFNVVNGTSASNIMMLSAANMTGKYTLFTVARFSGASKARIFQGQTGNYLHGFWSGKVGVHYNEGWRASVGGAVSPDTSWLMSSECTYDPSPVANSCTSTYSTQGKQASTSLNTVTTAFGLAINGKGVYTGESSDFQIADVIVFNKVLTIPEVNNIEKYLSDKYGMSIYSDLVANYDPGDSGTTKSVLKNLSKGSGYLADDLDLTLYGGALKSSSNGGSINLDRADSSFGQSASNMRIMSKFSGEIWVKPRADQGSYDYTSLMTMVYTNAGQHMYPSIVMSGTYYGTNAMKVEGGFYSGSLWRMSSGLSSTPAGYKIVPDTWYHLATTYDGTNVRFYVNGVQHGSTVATTDVLFRGDSPLRIGTRWDGTAADNGFNGLIGKIKVYDYGRSEAEVVANYNADKSRYQCGSTSTNTNGDVRVTFTTAGSCSWQSPEGVTKVNALLVGGGGGGGAWVGGGGGGGGVLEQSSVTVTPNSTYPITVGGGGSGSYFSSGAVLARGANGGSTSALGLTAYGGGRGATWTQYVTGGPGVATGGGGGTASSTGSFGSPDISPAQGFAGGVATGDWTYGYPTGGGGGAGGAGGAGATTGNPRASGNGGIGKTASITGIAYGGGGGGGCHGNGESGKSCANGSGVNGGGNGAGNGSTFINAAALFKGGDGSNNYGGGGGGSGAPSANSYSVHSQGGTGGSGIVVLQYFIGPTISGVTSSSSNGNYILGSTISLQVSFSEAVTVTGTPTLTVETGATDRAVAYASGSGTSSLTFTYTVQAGDLSSDLDYSSTTALELAGGTIRDSASNNAILTLPAPAATGSLGASKALVVDGAVPTYSSAAVNSAGTKVILTYSEALNSTTAATGAYSVTVAGISASISSAAVSASTVELTMATRIASGQLVNFTYTDPTSGDDANALQDSLGNDAVSKTSTAVTNNSSLIILSTPTGLTLSASAIKSIAVTWSSVSNASSYTVKLYDSTGATIRASKTGVTSPTSYTFTTSDYSLVDGDTYQVGVTAIGNSTTYLDSVETSKVSITTSSNLSVPASLAAAPTGTSPNGTRKSIDVTWGAVADVSSYTVKIYDVSTGGSVLATISNISNSATSTTITTTQYANMLDKTNYYITITSIGNGSTYLSSAESSRASVTTHAVASSVSISTNPSSQSKTAGQSVTFSVSATATDLGTLSYVWKKGSTTVGTNSSSYTFQTAATSDAGEFSVVVTNTLNGVATSATSSTATLSMSAALSFNARGNVTVTAGTELTGGTSILVTAINGRADRTYSRTGGSLPPGLMLDSSTGAITGTPTEAGTFPQIKITVTDANGATLEMASGFTITVNRGSQLPISIVTRYGTGGQSLTLAIQGGSGSGALTYTLDPNPQTSCQLSGSVLTPSFATGASGTCYVKATKAADAGFTATSSLTTAIFFTAYVPVVVQTMTCPAGTVPSNPSGIGVGSCMQVLAPVSTASGDAGAAPKITALSVATGTVGTSITITGTGFSSATKVQFGSKSTTTFTKTSTTITVNVPTGATSGRVMVFSPTGTAMAAQIFTVINADVRAPAYLSGNVNTSVPTQVTLNFDENLANTSLSASTFGVSVAGIARTVNSVSISGTTITLTLASAVSTGQAVLFTYTSPGDSTSIQDAAGNKSATIVATSLTNTL